MKRSEMQLALALLIEKEVLSFYQMHIPERIAKEVADKILTLQQDKGMLPPKIRKFVHYSTYTLNEWDPESVDISKHWRPM